MLFGLQLNHINGLSQITTSGISVTDMIGLLGYSNDFDIEQFDSSKGNKSNGTGDVLCSLKNCIKINQNLYPIHGFDPFNRRNRICDLNLYLKSWMDYLHEMASRDSKY